MRKKFLTFVCGGAMALFAVTGCINLTPKPDDTRFYVLSVPAPKPVESAPNAPAVGVRSVHVDEYLARPEMILRQGDSRVERLSLYRWASSPAAQVQKEFQRWCERYQPNRVFYFPPWNMRPLPTLELAWEVRRMEGVQSADDSSAVLEMGWSWIESGKNPVSFSGEWTAPWVDGKPETLVTLLNDLLGKAFHRIMETEPAPSSVK
jgi:uncharacterized lipoprotein YmbA